MGSRVDRVPLLRAKNRDPSFAAESGVITGDFSHLSYRAKEEITLANRRFVAQKALNGELRQ
jgi:hypothetical protein